MSRFKHKQRNRDGLRFAAMPHVVLDSPAYQSLGFAARALLLELARQFTGTNNGRLVLCRKALEPRGWNSDNTVNRAKKELIDAGLLVVTRQGQRPNKASWYGLTWLGLDWVPDMDIKQTGFERGAYLQNKT